MWISKDLGKLWNSAYCSLIHFCVNEKHVLNLSREIRWISLLLSFCQCRFTVSTGIMVQPIPTCITSLCQGNLKKKKKRAELMIRTRNHVPQETQTASNSEGWILFLTSAIWSIFPKSKYKTSDGRPRCVCTSFSGRHLQKLTFVSWKSHLGSVLTAQILSLFSQNYTINLRNSNTHIFH